MADSFSPAEAPAVPADVRDDVPAPRNPWVAAGLTLLVAGLGHVYAGRPWRGAALWLLLRLGGALVVLADVPDGFAAVARIVAMPGDTVEMRSGELRVGGRVVDEPYARTGWVEPEVDPVEFDWQHDFLLEDDVSYRPTHGTWGPLRVPEDHVLLLGDNRNRSVDGRYWGFVHLRDLAGRPDWIYLSMERDPLIPMGGRMRWGRMGEEIR